MKQTTRVALISIIVEKPQSAKAINDLLHDYGPYIIGRMGIPYRERSISLISVAIDGPADIINALSGKLGMIPYVNIKTIYPKLSDEK